MPGFQDLMPDFEKDLQKYQRQLEKGFKNLRFSDELEAEFIERYFERNLIKQRTALCVAFILLLMLAPLDYRVLENSSASTLYYTVVRLYISCPLLLIALLLTFTDFFKRQAQSIALLMLVTIGVGTNIVSVYGANFGLRTLYEGNILIIFVGYLLAGLRFRYSVASNILIAGSYLVLSLVYAPTENHDYHSYFFVFSALLIGGAAAYTQEYQARLGFLQQGALKNSAKIDPLTGLLNRGAINQGLDTIMHFARREKRFISLLLVDVDYFKRFNDFYGHTEGD
ncbi:MAG: diguanylate cyclase, partial [Ketobacteraceae bacterium]|nr:diguanylate cyclase [Ketobacteraceae bacterium]